MGGGSWDTKLYAASASTRKAKGIDDFAYSNKMGSLPSSEWAAAPEMDPAKVKDTVKGVRESRDSAEHPESVPIVVFFDVTGSMHEVPRLLQQKLAFLFEYVIARGGVEHPQILVGAFGDATCDSVPFQIGQFESDNRVDEQLRLLFLDEQGGGGQVSESYGLAFYALSRLTATDAWEKRGRKGYCFTIGDEMSWPLKATEIKEIFGTEIQEKQLEIDELIREAQEKWHLFHIIPAATSHGKELRIQKFWQELLGQHVLKIDDIDKICELIAAQVALMEGADFSDIKRDVGNDVAGALVVAGSGGWNAPAASTSGELTPPANEPGAATRF